MATRYQAAQSIQRTARRGSNGPNGKSDKPYSQTTTDIRRRKNSRPPHRTTKQHRRERQLYHETDKNRPGESANQHPRNIQKNYKITKGKNAAYHTFQLKTDKSYKAVIRGLHPKTNTGKISEELAKIGHQVRSINNINKYDTKQPLPLFLVELEPKNNNKEIYDIEKLLNTIVKVEPPRYKKEIPQCIRCQQYGHTKNYCNRTPACVKCAKNHLTTHCPSTGKIEEVKCYNCNGNHPASYKGCEVRKQLRRKLFPPLRNKSFNNHQPRQSITVNDTALTAQYEPNATIRSINPQGNRSYAQVTQNISQPTLTNNQNQNNNIEDATDIKEMLKQSIKSTEMLGKMVSELNATLRQQVQQTTVMLQLLTNLLSEK